MTKSQLIKKITRMIDECYNEETGEMSAKEEQGTYMGGLIEALQEITKLK